MNYKLTKVIAAGDWHKSDADLFWGEIAPSDHVLQIYETDDVFMETLAGFVGSGINAGDCVVVIATAEHISALDKRLKACAVHVDTLIADDRYIPLVADVILDKFMLNDMPEELRFYDVVNGILSRARQKGRKVRAFGEMVAILWAKGHYEATNYLEQLWCNICRQEQLSLFCAYPEYGFTEHLHSAAESLAAICNCHTKMIEGSRTQLAQVYYKNTKLT